MKFVFIGCFTIVVVGSVLIGPNAKSVVADRNQDSPFEQVELANWSKLYRAYDKTRRSDEEWDEKGYGFAFSQHIDAMEQGYDKRTVQEHAVRVAWEAKAATVLYANRKGSE